MDIRRYLLYHGRWQLSTVVMMGPMYALTTIFGLSGTLALPIVQVIGAAIFYYVDRWIFNDDD